MAAIESKKGPICPGGYEIVDYPSDLVDSPNTFEFYANLQADLNKHCELACSNGKHCRIKEAYKRVKRSVINIEASKEDDLS